MYIEFQIALVLILVSVIILSLTLKLTNNHVLLNRFIIWVFFSFVITIFPIACKCLISWLNSCSNISHIFNNGDLFIVSVALSASSISEIMLTRPKSEILTNFFLGCSFLIALISSLMFAYFSDGVNKDYTLKVHQFSLVIFLLSFSINTTTVLISQNITKKN